MSGPPVLLPAGTWYQPGPATLVRRGTGFAVLVPGTAKTLIDAAWSVLGDGGVGEGFADTLATAAGFEGAADLPALIFGDLGAESAVIGVKGDAAIAVLSLIHI